MSIPLWQTGLNNMNSKYSSKLPVFLVMALLCLGVSSPIKAVTYTGQAQVQEDHGLFHIPFVSKGDLDAPSLVLVLHGDAPFNNPSYQYGIARKIAKENENVVAVGVLRPGYTDEEGNRSKGNRGNATGDNWNEPVLQSIHTLATALKEKYKASQIILVGHSGGAAISANLLTKFPKSYDAALLISCPCDLDAWRKHMKGLQPEARIWDEAVDSPSPIEQVSRINKEAVVTLVHGVKDETVPVRIASAYRKALKAKDIQAQLIEVKNGGHEIAFNEKIFEILKAWLH